MDIEQTLDHYVERLQLPANVAKLVAKGKTAKVSKKGVAEEEPPRHWIQIMAAYQGTRLKPYKDDLLLSKAKVTTIKIVKADGHRDIADDMQHLELETNGKAGVLVLVMLTRGNCTPTAQPLFLEART